jgi:hypothetical protein
MPLGPFDADLDAATRHDLARRLRVLLVDQPLDVRAMAVALDVEPEVIVVVMRELRARRRGRLRSKVVLGHVSWWWEPDWSRKAPKSAVRKAAAPEAVVPEDVPDVPIGAKAPKSAASKKKGKRKGKRKKS